MKFTRLRLHGFKSFSDESVLHTEPGLTGIVGPNGCGKSNLVEAMRWVMGESSYKAMRASGMDDVIFSGSGNRPARNSAEVTLVLDNADRTAPAALNSADVLEVTRRIEREAGSVYRVNGREVRARDVQLLFADASTGAHSPAMVRQGQIGELIAAKPTARRALLEEAAGISGLHSRRHEAELRLRATEQNLERIDDIIGQIEAQLETLKRQARLAIRYRSLSGDIRRTEATLYHLRWVAARVSEKEAEAEQAVLVRRLADATHAEHRAQQALDVAEAALQPLREREAVAAAVLQRYTILLEQLADEVRRQQQRRADLDDRARQLQADGGRERELAAEADSALARLRSEAERLRHDEAHTAADLAQAQAASTETRARIAAAESAAREAADRLAHLQASQAQGKRMVAEARERLARIERDRLAVDRDAARLDAEADAETALAGHRATLDAARARSEAAEVAVLAAEAQNTAAQGSLDAARPLLTQMETALGRLEAEAHTLARLLQGNDSLWPPIADHLQVMPGYETALGAALGDDLEASADAGAPLHWADPIDHRDDPALPQAAEPLSRYVSGSPHLKRRLDQIGLVSAVDGAALHWTLKPGQRLVTLDGALWRWDGFIAAADAPSPAAQRLAQRNRLAELDAEILHAKAERNRHRREVETLAAALEERRQAERSAREASRLAQRAVAAAQGEVERAQRASAALASRRAALAEARTRLDTSLGEARQMLAAAEATGHSGDETALAADVNERRSALSRVREAADAARLRLSEREAAARQRQTRLSQIAADEAQWNRRRESAQAQLLTLEQRSADLAAQLASLAAGPSDHTARREALAEQIELARRDQAEAHDRLAVAQTGQREADRTARSAAQGLAEIRIALSRVEERIKGLIANRQQIERLVEENLGIPAARTLEASGIRPMDPLPAQTTIEQKLERLKAERERLGGVNLAAEAEAAEVESRRDTLVNDRDDLVQAIAKLRSGIAALNGEGRQRLGEAFERVNTHFRDLFTTLFGGGTAELSFVESDDPLEAGLEIIARPPGKKPQTMTLLSGGEQALTAMSLIFAVFLSNPAPICVLDEVDAPLDDANVERFCNLLDSMRQRTDTRFLVITHNPITMSRMDRLFGVTMAERGVSQLVSVDLTTAQAFQEAG